MDVANKSTILFQMLADGLQRFLSQLLFRVKEEAEGRDDIEGVTERLPCYVDLVQSDVVRAGRGSEHERGYVHSHDLREMIGRDRRDAACSAGEVETFLLWPAQLSQGCLK